MLKGIFRVIVDHRERSNWRYLVCRLLLVKKKAHSVAMEWQADQWFRSVLVKFGQPDSFHVSNLWNLHQLAKSCWRVPGDTAECGVFRGLGSYLICSALQRTHFAFDSFAGLSAPSMDDGDYWRKGDLTATLDVAQSNLNGFDVSFHPGWIPERFADVEDRSFSFVHKEVDNGPGRNICSLPECRS